MRAALYARYSDDELQSATSAADQLALMRGQLQARGWREAAAFVDEGISGAAIATRPGVRALMRLAGEGGCDVVFIEALDRISRGQSDVARLYELLTFHGVRLETLSRGVVSELNIGLEGTMNSMFLVELAKKTRRGLIGRVQAGFSGGGRCYGYRVAGKGELEVDPDEGAIVRRIFAAYVAGASTRTIARALNAEGIAGPRGGQWTPGALLGHRGARDGLLCQELYAGVRVFNRRRYRKHPETGRRSAVLNPQGEWIRKAAPELRIVDEETWSAARAREAAIPATTKRHAPTPARLLSGLLYCGSCDGPMWAHAGRYQCQAFREHRTCANAKIIRAETIEARVLEAVKTRLLSAEAIAHALKTYRLAKEAERTDLVRARAPLGREGADVDRRIARAQDAYEAGAYDVAELAARLTPLRARKAAIAADLAAAAAPSPVQLFPRTEAFYAALVEQLGEAVKGELGEETRGILRRAIGRVDLHPLPKKGAFELTVHGRLAALLGISEEGFTSDRVLGAGTRSAHTVTSRGDPLTVSFAA